MESIYEKIPLFQKLSREHPSEDVKEMVYRSSPRRIYGKEMEYVCITLQKIKAYLETPGSIYPTNSNILMCVYGGNVISIQRGVWLEPDIKNSWCVHLEAMLNAYHLCEYLGFNEAVKVATLAMLVYYAATFTSGTILENLAYAGVFQEVYRIAVDAWRKEISTSSFIDSFQTSVFYEGNPSVDYSWEGLCESKGDMKISYSESRELALVRYNMWRDVARGHVDPAIAEYQTGNWMYERQKRIDFVKLRRVPIEKRPALASA